MAIAQTTLATGWFGEVFGIADHKKTEQQQAPGMMEWKK